MQFDSPVRPDPLHLIVGCKQRMGDNPVPTLVLPRAKHIGDMEAMRWQLRFFVIVALQLALPVAIALVALLIGFTSVWTSQRVYLAVIVGLFVVGVFVQSLYSFAKLDRRWFICRSVAESATSVSWLYVMRAGAFQSGDEIEPETFRRTMALLEAQLRSEARIRLADDQLEILPTQSMATARASIWTDRRTLYVLERVDDQIAWYQTRSRRNARWSLGMSITSVGVQIVGAIWALYYVTVNLDGVAVVALLATVVASVVGWAQARQFSELVEPYRLAGLELARLRELILGSVDERELLGRVAETELTISREHASWLARRGVFRLHRD